MGWELVNAQLLSTAQGADKMSEIERLPIVFRPLSLSGKVEYGTCHRSSDICSLLHHQDMSTRKHHLLVVVGHVFFQSNEYLLTLDLFTGTITYSITHPISQDCDPSLPVF
jgi:hypothetical protein